MDVFSFPLPVDGTELSNHAGYSLTKIPGGLRLVSLSDEAPRTIDLLAANNDFRSKPDDSRFIMAVRETGPTHVENALAVGDFTSLDVVYLGGKKMNLQYSEFGIWLAYRRYTPTGGVISGHRYDDMVTIHTGDEASRKAFTAGNSNLTYTGNALASVRDVQHQVELFGSASLRLNTNQLDNASLELDFPDFYKFTASGINMDQNASRPGSFQGQVPTLAVQERNNSTGIQFDPAALTGKHVNVNAYGPAGPGQPTEASGTFSFTTATGDNFTWVNGSFGLK